MKGIRIRYGLMKSGFIWEERENIYIHTHINLNTDRYR